MTTTLTNGLMSNHTTVPVPMTNNNKRPKSIHFAIENNKEYEDVDDHRTRAVSERLSSNSTLSDSTVNTKSQDNQRMEIEEYEEIDQSERVLREWQNRKGLGHDRIPGVMGIQNHGNTCYINAIIQCLNHTNILAEYLVLGHYKIDMEIKRKRMDQVAVRRKMTTHLKRWFFSLPLNPNSHPSNNSRLAERMHEFLVACSRGPQSQKTFTENMSSLMRIHTNSADDSNSSSYSFLHFPSIRRNRRKGGINDTGHATNATGDQSKMEDESQHSSNLTTALVTNELSSLMKSLWTLQYGNQMKNQSEMLSSKACSSPSKHNASPLTENQQIQSQKFKSVVEKAPGGAQYKGGNVQHDAQEFLLWILDCLHNELHMNEMSTVEHENVTILNIKPEEEHEPLLNESPGKEFLSHLILRKLRSMRSNLMKVRKKHKIILGGGEKDEGIDSNLQEMVLFQQQNSFVERLSHEDVDHKTIVNCSTKCGQKDDDVEEEDDKAFEEERKMATRALLAHHLHSTPASSPSFISDVFQAQFRSTLTCVNCRKDYSNTFDPFLCISLPLATGGSLFGPDSIVFEKRFIYVVVVYLEHNPRQMRLGLTLDVDDSIRDLRVRLATDTGIQRKRIILTEVDSIGRQKILRDNQSIDVITSDYYEIDEETFDNEKKLKNHRKSMLLMDPDIVAKLYPKTLYCIETPENQKDEKSIDFDEDGNYVLLTWNNVFREEKNHAQGNADNKSTIIEHRFGSPYTMLVSREALYGDLQKLMLKTMSSILHDDILIGQQKVDLFKIKYAELSKNDNSSPSSLLLINSHVQLPLYSERVEETLNLFALENKARISVSIESPVLGCSGFGGPVHLPLILQWDMPGKSQVIARDTNDVEDHVSVRQTRKEEEETMVHSSDENATENNGQLGKNDETTLENCFALYTSPETIHMGVGGGWHCSSCDQRRSQVVKRMGLWSLPDILIVHLKRFRTTSRNVTRKLATLVDFPLVGLDMRPNISSASRRRRSSSTPHSSPKISASIYSVNPVSSNEKEQNDFLYDLYGVCDHHGTDLQSGHYTSTCLNASNGRWYKYDDTRVTEIEMANIKKDVVTRNAYILFYQRRSRAKFAKWQEMATLKKVEGDDCVVKKYPNHWVFNMDLHLGEYETNDDAKIESPNKNDVD